MIPAYKEEIIAILMIGRSLKSVEICALSRPSLAASFISISDSQSRNMESTPNRKVVEDFKLNR